MAETATSTQRWGRLGATDLHWTARATWRRPSFVRNWTPKGPGLDGSHVTGSQGAPAPRIDDTKGRLVNHDLGDERRVRHHRRNDDQPSQPGELFAGGAVRPVRVEDLRVQQCRRQKQGHGASKATHPHARAPHLVRSGHQLSLVQTSSRRQGTESLPRKVWRPSQRSGRGSPNILNSAERVSM